MIFEKSRFEIWNAVQHPLKHSVDDFAYYNPALPWVTNLKGVMDAMVAVSYPNTQPAVDTKADLLALPAGGNTPLDYRVVLDDGDGKAAGYRWEKREGDADYSWYKIYDMDWGEETILSNFLTKTNDTYVSKKGQDDIDANGDLLTGDLAGQYIYGGASANSNLTLYANSGDGTGSQTGFIQFGDQVSPLLTDVIDLGSLAKKFNDLHLSGEALVDTMTIGTGSIVDSTGAINFGTTTLSTLGDVYLNDLFMSGFIEMDHIATPSNSVADSSRLYFKADGKLYRLDESGVEKLVGLDFASTNDNRLIRSNGVAGESIQESLVELDDLGVMSGLTKLTVDNLELDGTSIATTSLNTDLNLVPNGTGTVVVPSLKLVNFTQDKLLVADVTGNLTARGVSVNALNELLGTTRISVDNLQLDGNTLSSTDVDGNLVIEPNGLGKIVVKSIKPDGDNTRDIGEDSTRIKDLYLAGSLKDGTDTFSVSELMKLREASIGASAGMSLFFDGTKWAPSLPDTEIDHGEISGLGDDDHLQYVAKDGRATGQTINGGTGASENLTLESTTDATKGQIIFGSDLVPSDTTKEVGSISKPVNTLYVNNIEGFKLKNVTTATTPAASAAGLAYYNTDTKQIMVDNGISVDSEGVNRYIKDLTFDGSETLKDEVVSSKIVDARNATVQLLNNNNDFDRVYCTLKAINATTIRIETNSPLPIGSYRLIVIE